jgi:hypothetical protein
MATKIAALMPFPDYSLTPAVDANSGLRCIAASSVNNSILPPLFQP